MALPTNRDELKSMLQNMKSQGATPDQLKQAVTEVKSAQSDIDFSKPQPGFIERAGEAIKGEFGKAQDISEEARQKREAGEPVEAAVKQFTAGAKALISPITGVVEAAVEPIAEKGIETFTGALQTGLKGRLGEEEGEAAFQKLGADFQQDVAQAIQTFEELPSEAKTTAQLGVTVAEIVTTAVGGKALKKVAKEAAEQIPVAAKVAKEAVEETFERGATKLDETITKVGEGIEKQLFPERSLDELTGVIIQGAPDQISSAKKALSLIDKEGVKTFSDLADRAAQKRIVLSREVDDVLIQQPEIRKLDDLKGFSEVEGEIVGTNFVERAIEDLRDLYTKIGDDVELARLKNFEEKVVNEGISTKDLNDFARRYGSEFKSKAFTKAGLPKEGVNAIRLESTRQGLKGTVRQFLPDEKTRILDSEISTLFDLQDNIDKLVKKTALLKNKLEQQNIVLKKVGEFAEVADILSGRFFSSLITRGPKTFNAADLEEQLIKNLTKFDKALEAEGKDAVIEALR